MGEGAASFDRVSGVRLTYAYLRKHQLAVILFAIGVTVRFVYLVSYSKSPFFQVHIADALYHEEWARRILNGDIFSQKIPWALYKPPLYPYFLSLSYLVSGKSHFLPMFLQVLISAWSSVLLLLIGKRYFSELAAFVGALVFSFYFPSVYFSTEMEIPTLAIFLTLLSFYMLGCQSIRTQVASAVSYGLSLLTLPTNLLLLPLCLFMLVKHEGRAIQGRRHALHFCAITLFIVAPSILNNSIASSHLTFISSNGGINLHIGNNSKYDETVSLQPGYAFEDFYDEPRRVAGVNSFAERDLYWYKKAFHFITQHPREEAALLLKKVALYFADYEIYRNTDSYYAKANSIYRHIPFVPASIVLATGLIGAFLSAGTRKNRELVAFAVLQALPCVIFFVTDRYRLPSMAIWALFSGLFVTFMVDALRAKAWDTAALGTALATGVAVTSNLNLFVVKNPEYRPHLNLGFIYEAQGKYDRSIAEYSAALRLVQKSRPPDFKTESELYDRLGNVQMIAGNLPEAESNFDAALRTYPNSGPAYSYLGSLYDKQKRGELSVKMFTRALEINPWDCVSLHNLGLFYINSNQFGEAVEKLKRVVQLSPEDSGAHSDLAYAYGQLGKFDLMEAEAKSAIDFDPVASAPRYNLALALLNTSRVDEAMAQYRTIAKNTPREASNAYNQLGVIFAQRGDLQHAIENWQKALEVDPNNTSAQANIQRAKLLMPQAAQ
jgi:tetratricopeptide (TPR) repeat protein